MFYVLIHVWLTICCQRRRSSLQNLFSRETTWARVSRRPLDSPLVLIQLLHHPVRAPCNDCDVARRSYNSRQKSAYPWLANYWALQKTPEKGRRKPLLAEVIAQTRQLKSTSMLKKWRCRSPRRCQITYDSQCAIIFPHSSTWENRLVGMDDAADDGIWLR